MAVNPMQRRARNSFLIGFLVALIIMALVVVALLYKIKSINDAKEAIEARQSKVLVAASDLESGELVTLEESFKIETVQTTVDKTQVISEDDFYFYDEDGEVITKYNEDGSEKVKELEMKVDVPAGTIVTKEMFKEIEEDTDSTDRIMEYSMILLPSQLKNKDYIDIRISLPNGQDFIILSKKRVIGCNSSTIWIKVNELEVELLNSAIVEAYSIIGSKLYATQYSEPGMQEASSPTYIASPEVINLISRNPNVIDQYKEAYTRQINEFSDYRVQYFQGLLDETSEERGALVQSGNSEEIEKIKAARQEFVDSLDGSEDIGYTR